MGEAAHSSTQNQDEDDDAHFSEDEAMSDVEEEKDATEEELERLVFGDAARFKDELRGFQRRYQLQNHDEAEDQEEGDENNLTHVPSNDVRPGLRSPRDER